MLTYKDEEKGMINKKEAGITIIIPIYNAEKYLTQCMDSVLASTYSELEILCIDDGSIDTSGHICDMYAAKDARVKVVHCENGGASKARNRGIEDATYDIIAFVDSDDIINSRMYESMMRFGKEYNLDCVCCNCNVVGYDGKEGSLKTPFKDRERLYKEQVMEYIIEPLLGFSSKSTNGLCSVCNKLFRRSIIMDKNIRFNETRSHGEDWQFCIEYFREIYSIGFMQEKFYNYIHHTSNSLVNKYRDNYFALAIFNREYFKLLFPTLAWDTPERIQAMWNLPIASTIYYRQFFRGEELNNKLIEIYELCKSHHFIEYDCNLNKMQRKLRETLYENNKDKFLEILKWSSWFGYLQIFFKSKLKQYYTMMKIVCKKLRDCKE